MVFAGKVALVTGASRGVGKATALRLAAAGADVVVGYRRNDELASRTVEEIAALGRRAIAVKADLERVEDIRELFDTARGEFGGLDIFVASAAASAFRPLMQVKDYNITRTFDISVRGFVIAAQEAVKLMEGRRGKIVAISGYDTLRYLPGHGTLAAAKAALEQLIIYLACELAERGINVNGVNPGAIDTDSARIFAASTGTDWERFSASWKGYTPKRRLATPDDIAKVITFLCSEDAEWITGQTIVADGGLTLTAGFDIIS